MGTVASFAALIAPPRPRLGRSLLAGLASGVAGGLAATAAWAALGSNPGTPTAPFGPGPIMAATLVLNLLGGALFQALAWRLPRPVLVFRALGLLFATLYSAALFGEPSLAPIARDATVLHYLAAAVALVVIPRLAAPARRTETA